MIRLHITTVACMALAASLVACSRAGAPTGAADEVVAAQAERQVAVTEARSEQAQVQAETAQGAASPDPDVRSDAIEDRAEASYRTALAAAKGDQDVAVEACNAKPAVDQQDCVKTAQAKYEAARSAAQVALDAERTRSKQTGRLDN